MSATFYGRTASGQAITLDVEDPAYLNMSCGNGRAFLLFLGLEPGAEPSGEIILPDARRAIMRARATFERRVWRCTREDSDTKRPGQARVIEGGLDEDYFARRLNDFEMFVGVVAERGATSIGWG